MQIIGLRPPNFTHGVGLQEGVGIKKGNYNIYNEINLAFHCYLIFLSHYKDNDICIKGKIVLLQTEIEFEKQA